MEADWLWFLLAGEAMPTDPDQQDRQPAGRGHTIVTPIAEEAVWPCVNNHRLHLVWDRRTDEMTARIIIGAPKKA